MNEIHPLNNLDLSEDNQFVECWHNGQRCYTIHIDGQLKDAVARGQEWFSKWSEGIGKVSKVLQGKINESL